MENECMLEFKCRPVGREREVDRLLERTWSRTGKTTSREKEKGAENVLLKIVNSHIVLLISFDLFSYEGRLKDKTMH